MVVRRRIASALFTPRRLLTASCRSSCSAVRRKSTSASSAYLRMVSRTSMVGVVTVFLLGANIDRVLHEDDAVAACYPVDRLLTPRTEPLLNWGHDASNWRRFKSLAYSPGLS